MHDLLLVLLVLLMVLLFLFLLLFVVQGSCLLCVLSLRGLPCILDWWTQWKDLSLLFFIVVHLSVLVSCFLLVILTRYIGSLRLWVSGSSLVLDKDVFACSVG